jgi:hypothetical protein
MRLVLAAAALALLASPLAAETVAPKRGTTLRDAKAARLGPIDRVNADGSVQIIFNSRFVTIPADKLTVGEKGVATLLTKAEVSKLR